MKILITGGSGFIGNALSSELINLGHTVSILSRTINKDISSVSREDIEDMDVIFHLASTIDNSAIYSDNPAIDFETNCIGTIKLLDACQKYNKFVRIIYVSSYFAVGNNKHYPSPLGLYGVSKLATEHICKIYNSVYNMNIITCRLSNVYGVGETQTNRITLNRIIWRSLNNIPTRLVNNGDIYRDYIYIDDCVSALILLMKCDNDKTIYEIGTGISTKMHSLLECIKEIIPSTEIELVEEFDSPMTIYNYVSNNNSLRRLGWKHKVYLKDGINKVVEHYKSIEKSENTLEV
jgi:UDP-glucose 4-epimerase